MHNLIGRRVRPGRRRWPPPDRHTQGVSRHHQRRFAAGRLDLNRQGHVFTQERRSGLRQRELDLDRPALCIDQWRNRQHLRRETLAGEGVGEDAGRLADLQLSEMAFVDLRHQLQRASRCQSQQRMPGLYDHLAGLGQASQHRGIGGGQQHGLRQARLGGGGGGTRQCELRHRLQHIGALLCVGHALGARAGLLRLRDGSRPACLVEARVTEKTPGHQRLRSLQVGLSSRQDRIRLRPPRLVPCGHPVLRSPARRAAVLAGAAVGKHVGVAPWRLTVMSVVRRASSHTQSTFCTAKSRCSGTSIDLAKH